MCVRCITDQTEQRKVNNPRCYLLLLYPTLGLVTPHPRFDDKTLGISVGKSFGVGKKRASETGLGISGRVVVRAVRSAPRTAPHGAAAHRKPNARCPRQGASGGPPFFFFFFFSQIKIWVTIFNMWVLGLLLPSCKRGLQCLFTQFEKEPRATRYTKITTNSHKALKQEKYVVPKRSFSLALCRAACQLRRNMPSNGLIVFHLFFACSEKQAQTFFRQFQAVFRGFAG